MHVIGRGTMLTEIYIVTCKVLFYLSLIGTPISKQMTHTDKLVKVTQFLAECMFCPTNKKAAANIFLRGWEEYCT